MSALPVYEVLRGICLTEKTAFLAEAKNVYTFFVHPEAAKPEIADAVKRHFGVAVVSVNTLRRAGRPRRFRGRAVLTVETKRAIVKVDSKDRIALY